MSEGGLHGKLTKILSISAIYYRGEMGRKKNIKKTSKIGLTGRKKCAIMVKV